MSNEEQIGFFFMCKASSTLLRCLGGAKSSFDFRRLSLSIIRAAANAMLMNFLQVLGNFSSLSVYSKTSLFDNFYFLAVEIAISMTFICVSVYGPTSVIGTG